MRFSFITTVMDTAGFGRRCRIKPLHMVVVMISEICNIYIYISSHLTKTIPYTLYGQNMWTPERVLVKGPIHDLGHLFCYKLNAGIPLASEAAVGIWVHSATRTVTISGSDFG